MVAGGLNEPLLIVTDGNPGVSPTPAGERQEIPTGYEQAIPGMMVMFTMLIILLTGSLLLVIEREEGLLRRLASTPITPGSVVLGKWTARMAMGLVQIGFGFVIAIVFFQMQWGNTVLMIFAVMFGWRLSTLRSGSSSPTWLARRPR